MSGRNGPASMLHLQMGQEVIYLLLVTSLLANLVMAIILTRTVKTVAQTQVSAPPAETKAPAAAPACPVLASPKSEEREETAQPPDQPPIITLREADGFSFAPGSAELSSEFVQKLPSVVEKINALSEEYHAQIVEIIGHTDGTAVGTALRKKSNLDEALADFDTLEGAAALVPFDNAGLGMSRAVSVARALRQTGLPAKLDIQPLSAAYLISPQDRAEPAERRRGDSSRRRIEIRIRRVNSN